MKNGLLYLSALTLGTGALAMQAPRIGQLPNFAQQGHGMPNLAQLQQPLIPINVQVGQTAQQQRAAREDRSVTWQGDFSIMRQNPGIWAQPEVQIRPFTWLSFRQDCKRALRIICCCWIKPAAEQPGE